MKIAFPVARKSNTASNQSTTTGSSVSTTTGSTAHNSEPFFALSPSRPRIRLCLKLTPEGKNGHVSPTPEISVMKMERRRHSITTQESNTTANTAPSSSSDSFSSVTSSSSLPLSPPLCSPVKTLNNNPVTSLPTTTLRGIKFNPTKRVPASSITYDVVTRVVDSWEQGIRCFRNWETKIGQELAFKVLENDPEAKSLFGIVPRPVHAKVGMAPAGESSFQKGDFYKLSMSSQLEFMAKSQQLIRAIDAAICTLGPDLSLFQRQCHGMGDQLSSWTNKNNDFLQVQRWASAGESLLQILECHLGKARFTDEHCESWIKIYNFACYQMVTSILQKTQPNLVPNPAPEVVVSPVSPPKKAEIESQAAVVAERRKKGSISTGEDSSSIKVETTKKQPVSLDCTKPVLLDDITFEMVSHVLSSWDRGVKEIPNWNIDLGVAFMRYIFKHTGAEGRKLMGYPADAQWDDPAFATDPTFQKKGKRLIEAIDMALGFLGPDLSPLETTMVDLGRRHYYMNCQPEQWPLVGEALFDVFRESMGKDGSLFTHDVEEAWTIIYNFLGYHMIKGLKAEKAAVARAFAKK